MFRIFFLSQQKGFLFFFCLCCCYCYGIIFQDRTETATEISINKSQFISNDSRRIILILSRLSSSSFVAFVSSVVSVLVALIVSVAFAVLIAFARSASVALVGSVGFVVVLAGSVRLHFLYFHLYFSLGVVYVFR